MSVNRRSPEEIAKSVDAAKKVMAKEKLNEYKKSVRNARIALLVVGILQIAIGLWEAYGPLDLMLGLIIDGGIGVIFIGLFFWSKTQPKPAFITGLIVYISVILILVALDPTTIFKGLIMKIIIIATLVSGLGSVSKIPATIKPNDDLLDEINPIEDL